MLVFYFKMDTLGLLVAILISFLLACNGEISDDVKEMASKWAPLVWIHPEDPFYPSNIDFYLESMEVLKTIRIIDLKI